MHAQVMGLLVLRVWGSGVWVWRLEVRVSWRLGAGDEPLVLMLQVSVPRACMHACMHAQTTSPGSVSLFLLRRCRNSQACTVLSRCAFEPKALDSTPRERQEEPLPSHAPPRFCKQLLELKPRCLLSEEEAAALRMQAFHAISERDVLRERLAAQVTTSARQSSIRLSSHLEETSVLGRKLGASTALAASLEKERDALLREVAGLKGRVTALEREGDALKDARARISQLEAEAGLNANSLVAASGNP